MFKSWNPNQSEKWNTIVAQASDGGFLQSWQWGEFNEALGNAVYNVSNEEETILAQCLQLKAGNQWILVIPRGPVMTTRATKDQFDAFISDLKDFAKQRQCFLIRFDPAIESHQPQAKWLQQSSIKKAQRERQPVHTLIIDTSLSEEDLLKQMKSKWRYNIALAQRKGVEVQWSDKAEDAKVFADIMQQTTDRQDFAGYDQSYFDHMVQAGGDVQFVFAKYEGKPIAALLIAFFGKRAYYLHGGSVYEYRALMAPHLLQWEAIKEAKKRKMLYDFWGVATNPPSNKQEQHWGGITRFKQGFAPQKELTEYVGAYEISVKPLLYLLYRLRGLLAR